jgi:ABC-type bacteriocin/lantibiotic exporter with double-glycine peptidase domain
LAGTDDDVEPGAPATRAGAVRDWLDDLLERFPALGRLQAQLTGKRVPFQVGLAPAECGVACLTMVLGYHRKWVDVEEVRARLDARQGTDAQHVIAVARQFGLVGRAVSVASDEFRYLDPGSILYWNFNHFVVFERERRWGITILDPLAGRREIPSDEVRKHFTGIALTFEPGADFQHGGRRRSHFRRFLVDVLKDFSLAGRILFTSLVVQVLSLSLPFFTGMAVESVIPRSDRQLLLILCLSLAGVVGAFLLATLVRAHLIVFWQARLDARLNTSLMSHLLSLPYDFFQSRSRAEIAYRLESANALREGLTGAVVSAVLDGVMVLLYAGLVFWMNLRLGGVVTLLALLQVLTFALYWRREQVAAAEVVITTARSHTVASDLVDAIETVKAQSLERRASQYWVRAFVDSENAQIKRNQLNAWAEGLSATIRVGSPLVVLALGTQLVID